MPLPLKREERCHASYKVLDIDPIYGKDTYSGRFSQLSGEPTDSESPAACLLVDFMFGRRSQYQLSSHTIVRIRRQFHFATKGTKI
jgi:hypothetical protein